MGFLIGLLTFVMVVDCAILVLLVLIQLPKKEAGAGLAFGGGATDALFGAGSGTVLTKITKYAATGFFVLAVILSVMHTKYHQRNLTRFGEELNKARSTQTAPAPMPAVTPSSTATLPASTNAGSTQVVEQPLLSTVTNTAPAVTNAPTPK